MGKWPEEKMRRWVTVYTDAGWKQGRARTGFIARGSVDPVWLEGSGRVGTDSVAAAEAVAVLDAIRKVGAAFLHPDGLEGFFVRSDNLQVVTLLQSQCRGQRQRTNALHSLPKRDLRRAVRGIFELCEERSWTLLVKHVRAHGRENDRVRRWMNSRADRLGNMRGVDVQAPKLDNGTVFDDAAMDALLQVED